MDLFELFEADGDTTPAQQVDPSVVNITTTVDPMLRRALGKLANSKRLTRDELGMVIGTFKQLMATEAPADLMRIMRLLKRVYK